MGGLRKYMPITFITFLIASLANAGVPPFAGFWSKDEIIAGTWTTEFHPMLSDVLTIVALLTALISAFYMFRLVFLVFFGKPRFDTEHVHPHESPWTMTVPLIILAVFALGFGALVGFPPDEGEFHKFLEPAFESHSTEVVEAAGVPALASIGNADSSTALVAYEGEEGAAGEEAHSEGHKISDETKITFAVISSILALLGIALAYFTYMSKRIDPAAVSARFQGIYNLFYNKWYFDEIYESLIVDPLRRLSMFLWKDVDVGLIDGFIMGIAGGVTWLSGQMRKLQTGLVGNYALAIALGMVVIVGIYFAGFSDLLR